MSRPTCGNCAYWHEGGCRRHAPRPPGTAEHSEGALPSQSSQSGHWPQTNAGDWCGEFSPKDAVGPASRPRVLEKVTLTAKEPVRRGRSGQIGCRGLVCTTDQNTKLVIWGRDSDMRNLHRVNRARLPCRISFVATEPEGWSRDRYGDTHWVEPDALLDVLDALDALEAG